MMLTVTCYDCGEMYSLRGWIEKKTFVALNLKKRWIELPIRN